MTLDVTMQNRDQVIALNEACCKTRETIWIHSNSGLMMVDARSLLGMFALIGQPCKLVAEDDCDPNVLMGVARRAGLR